MNIYIIRGHEFEQTQFNNLERVLRKYNVNGFFNVKFISKIIYDEKEAFKLQALANKHDSTEINDFRKSFL